MALVQGIYDLGEPGREADLTVRITFGFSGLNAIDQALAEPGETCLLHLVLCEHRTELFIHLAHCTPDFFRRERLAVTHALLQPE
ncbi:hypothetical protein X989_3449 [Burkholderia pseudomallei MSHR4378]|nr:hypothetical protein X989_3449 [Burkholderia pseudomallei MSHR4378]